MGHGLETLPPWALEGVQIFAVLSDEPDFEDAAIDGTMIKVQQYGVGAKEGSKSGVWPLARRLDDHGAVANMRPEIDQLAVLATII